MVVKRLVNPRRVRAVNHGHIGNGAVIYWMHRNMRLKDNWGLLYARELASARDVPLAVVFCLVPEFLDATLRQYGFLLRGLEELEADLAAKNIPFFLRMGQDPAQEILRFADKHSVGSIVTDFDPLRVKRGWVEAVGKQAKAGVLEVDSRNVVPCWIASDKQEYAARTIRPKIHRLLPEFLEDFPTLEKYSVDWPEKAQSTDWDTARDSLKVDDSVAEVDWIEPGEQAAAAMLEDFIEHKLNGYSTARNNPTKGALSHMSPYLHFGHISAQRVALEVGRAGKIRHCSEDSDAYVEELIVRRELSDNYCAYCADYDNPKGFPEWAVKTLEEHQDDTREHVYTRQELEDAATHDPLWNAAQREMVVRGKMHGYMRMYWAKKILEWTNTYAYAQQTAIYLNDKYELDGRDSNGYTGVAWSIGGVHDRAWPSRNIFGKIRFMSYGGAKSKFDVAAYIRDNEDA